MFKISENPQNSEEWFTEDRLGKVTGSIFSKIVTKTGKRSASLEEVVNRAVAELIMRVPDETFQSDSMLRGKELEDKALEFFNFVYGYEFEKCGFMDAVDEEGESLGYGVSPDGIWLSKNLGLELKCPEAHTHLAYLSSQSLPDKYIQQVQGALMVSKFDKWVFGSFHPSLPCFRVEVGRDEKLIKAMEPLVKEAAQMVKEKYLELFRMVEAS